MPSEISDAKTVQLNLNNTKTKYGEQNINHVHGAQQSPS